MPAVSIVVTAWNRAAVLPRTLDSLLAQTFGDFELILMDDCSSDHTEEVGRAYEKRDQRIRYHRNPRNLNMPGNLNAGIQRARGAYIANLHDGDVYRPDLIAKWKEALDTYPSAAFVFNDYQVTLPDGTSRIDSMPFDGLVPGREILLHYLSTRTSCVWGTVMVRASTYAAAGLFDPTFGFFSDVEMWLRLTTDADAVYIKEPLITLGPRPEDHPFRHGLWQSEFWSWGIYAKYLHQHRNRLPKETAHWRACYSANRRRGFICTLLSCLKRRRWRRVREGLAVWADAPDPLLRWVGRLLGRYRWRPDWYDQSYWAMTNLWEETEYSAAADGPPLPLASRGPNQFGHEGTAL